MSDNCICELISGVGCFELTIAVYDSHEVLWGSSCGSDSEKFSCELNEQ